MKHGARLSDKIKIRVSTADPSGILMKLTTQNILLENITFKDHVTVEFMIHRSSFHLVKATVSTRSENIQVIHESALHTRFRDFIRRPLLTASILTLAFLSLFLPTRILFIDVSGNEKLSKNFIISVAENYGITFGAARNHVRSEKVKNEILQEIPQLQWLGVNSTGCTATITVKERSDSDDVNVNRMKIGNIVAIKDGLVINSTVEQGSSVCKLGQAVKKGQILVSGYVDNGIVIQAVEPKGEIYALTNRTLNAVSPIFDTHRGQIIKVTENYSILFGKNLIKLSNSSGISDATCVKIYNKHNFALPGDHAIPITLIRESCYYYSMENQQNIDDSDFSWAEDVMHEYLRSEMIAGDVVKEDLYEEISNGVYQINGNYICVEMIGKFNEEEIVVYDE